MTEPKEEPGPQKRLEKNIVWFALGMIVVGVLGTVGFIAWLRGEVVGQVREALREPSTVETIARQPEFLKPLAAVIVDDHKNDLPKGDSGTDGQPGPFFGKIMEKGGNDGTASCDRFCSGRAWGGFTGTCVGARLVTGSDTGEYIACRTAPGPGNHLKCWCSTFE